MDKRPIKSKRVVIDCGLPFKKRAYRALAKKDITMKDWFLENMGSFIDDVLGR